MNPHLYQWRAVLAALALSAAPAVAAPAPSPPLVPVPPHFKNAAAPALTVAPDDAAWWGVFHDATLDGLERGAVASNQDLARAITRIDEARQATRTAAAGFLPTIESNLGASRQRTSNNGAVLHAQFVGSTGVFGSAFGAGGGTIPPLASRGLTSTYNDYRAPLTASYELDVFGRIRHAYAGARASAQAAEADRRAVALSLSAEVATDYFTLRALDSQTGVLRRNLDLRRDAVRLSQERLDSGVAGPADLARARVELDNTQADAAEVTRERAALENNLAALCGQSASTFQVSASELEETAPPAIPAGVPMQLLSRRPDIVAAERALAAANENIGVARAQFLPTFNIEGNAGLESADADRLFEGQSRALSVLGTIHVPIFEGGRNVADLRAAQARRAAALDAYRGTAIVAYKEVETALSDLRQRAAQAAARRRAQDDAAQLLDLSQKRYIEGAVNYLEVVDAQRSLLGAQLNAVETLDERYTATIALVRAIGGAWGAPPAVPPARH